MRSPVFLLAIAIAIPLSLSSQWSVAEDELVRQATDAQRRAVQFFHDQVAVHGGYVYQVTSDLQWREGEGDAGKDSVWVQPPGTPSVGLAYLDAYRRTGDAIMLAAAKDAATCLIQGQLHSGGWQNRIDFSDDLRPKLAYRVDGPLRKKARNWSSFDDDQTQSALRFLMELDRVLEFKDQHLHATVEFGLTAVAGNQFPNGAWSQVFDKLDTSRQYPDLPASYPATWPREYPGGDYWQFYTLNDQAHVRVMQMMWQAFETYQLPSYRDSAIKAGDFLLKAQMPDPQPAWAQQYNYEMQPVWARKFEPPAVSGSESQVAIEALLDLATKTGDRKYIEPIARALDYLERSQLPDGRLARFNELRTNRPLYFTKDYRLVYDDSDLPTHYGFKVSSGLAKLRAKFEKLNSMDSTALIAFGTKERERRVKAAPSPAAVQKIIAALDDRGAWVELEKLRYIKQTAAEQPMILSATFVENLDQLSRFVAAHSQSR